VSDVLPGVGMTLTDCLDETSVHKVQERSASRKIKQWDVISARPVQVPAGHWELSGVLSHIPRNHVDDLIHTLKHEIEMESEGDECFVISQTIASKWLSLVLDYEPFMPHIMDAATGEPMLLHTEHYQVKNWEVLAARLSELNCLRRVAWVRMYNGCGSRQ